jgi:hypothetical protein
MALNGQFRVYRILTNTVQAAETYMTFTYKYHFNGKMNQLAMLIRI